MRLTVMFIQEPKIINDLSVSKARGFKEPKPHVYVKQDFVLATVEECVEARRKAAGPKWLALGSFLSTLFRIPAYDQKFKVGKNE